MQTFSVIGTPVAATNYERLSSDLIEASARKILMAVDFSNTQIVTLRRHDREFNTLTSAIDIFVPDGMPLVWVMNWLGAGLSDRVYGPTFTRKFLQSCPPDQSHYLIGGSPLCGKLFRENLRRLNPALNFAGSCHSYCDSQGRLEDEDIVIRELQQIRPDFIWIGLGTPKQYGCIARLKKHLSSGILLSVGFAFDVNAGTKSDAPRWMQRLGLTWIFRLLSEPARLGPRYAKFNTLFCWYLLQSWLCHRLRKSPRSRPDGTL